MFLMLSLQARRLRKCKMKTNLRNILHVVLIKRLMGRFCESLLIGSKKNLSLLQEIRSYATTL